MNIGGVNPRRINAFSAELPNEQVRQISGRAGMET